MTRPARPSPLADLLAHAPVTSALDPPHRDAILGAASSRRVGAREVVYMTGDPGEALFLVAEGRVKISRVTADGKELTLGYRVAGDLFGEACLIDGGPREELAEAMVAGTLVALPREPVALALASCGPFAEAFARAAIARQREMERRMEDLVFKHVSSKLAELLLELAAEHGRPCERGVLVDVKMTHQEMANLIGSTRETVSLTISRFRRRGLLASEGRRFILVDEASLRALA